MKKPIHKANLGSAGIRWWVIVLMLLPFFLKSQSTEEKRLRAELEAVTTDTARARVYGQLAWEVKFTNNEEARQLADEEIKLAGGNALLLADAYRTQALVNVIENKLPEGLELYAKSIENARKAKSFYYEASCNSLIAGMFQDLGDYDKALHYYFEGLKLAQEGKEVRMTGTLYNNIASVYGEAGYGPQKALRYYALALQQARELKSYAFAGLVAANMASEYLSDSKQDSSQLMINEAMRYIELSGTSGYEKAVVLTNVGDAYSKMGKSAEAEKYLQDAIVIQDSLKRPINVLGPISSLCNLYLQEDKTTQAEVLGKRLLQDALTYNAKPYIREGYHVLSEVASKQKQDALALQYYRQYSAWNDSVFNDNREKSIANVQSRADLAQKELEVQYETDKKEKENQILKLQNITLRTGVITAVFAVLLLSILAFMVYRSGKIKERTNLELEAKNKLIENRNREKDILMQEIHHRVKNNLQIVSSLLNLQGNSISDPAAKDALRESHNRVKSIALIHQKLYMQDDLSALSLEEYVVQLGAHLKNVFNAQQIDISCSAHPPHLKLDMESSIPLGVILNELITNSIKYGHINRAGGFINIRFTDDLGGNCTMQYVTNGIGLPEEIDFRNSPSLGLRMVNELARQLHGKLNYVRSPQPTFTLVFPLKGNA